MALARIFKHIVDNAVKAVITMETRQKAGRLLVAGLPAGVNVPAATDCAVNELTSFSLMLPNCSQLIAGFLPLPCPWADAVPHKAGRQDDHR
jgi:hypothetical protein